MDAIERLSRILNAPGTVPERYYRRNVIQYELVSYVATCVALWFSGNTSVLVTFLARADAAFQKLESHLDQNYAEIVKEYLEVVANELAKLDSLTDGQKAELPSRLLTQRTQMGTRTARDS